jgi:adenosylcobinamide-GDP ribazoletransferase
VDPRPFLIAARLLTRLPLPDPREVAPMEAGRAVPWYPLIGLILGVLIGAAGLLVSAIDPRVAALLVLMLWVWATGALHLDGLADSADAWIGGLGDRERTLQIMKDPRSGPAAIVVLVLVLIGKWSALAVLIDGGLIWPLLVAPLVARALLPLLMLTTPYARRAGMALESVAHLPRGAAAGAVIASAPACVLIGGWGGLLLCVGGGATFMLARRVMLQRLAGFTGDTAGALVEITETALLILAVLLMGATSDSA